MDETAAAATLTEDVSNSFTQLMNSSMSEIAKTVLHAVILLVICLVVRRIVLRILEKGLARSKIDKNVHAFFLSFARILLWILILMVVAGSIGIDPTSLIAVLSVAGLAISLAVQGSLSNLAGGITILLTKPFVLGDFVDIDGTSGTVSEIGMVHTKLNTLDNRRITIPNSNITDAKVTNYSTEPLRRVDINVSASYDAPIESVKSAIQGAIADHPKTLREPDAPAVRVTNYGDSAIEYVVRVWTKNADYWEVYYDLLEQIKTAFDAAGIEMTYPHMNVHILDR